MVLCKCFFEENQVLNMNILYILLTIVLLAKNLECQQYYRNDPYNQRFSFVPLQNDVDSRVVFNEERVKSYDDFVNEQIKKNNDLRNKAGTNNGVKTAQQTFSEEKPIVSAPIKLGPGTTDFEQINNITFAITKFGVELLKAVSKTQSGNIIVSPTSVATILALLQQGTYGEAQNEITRTLQMPPEVTAPTYKRLTIDMRKRNSRNILTVANNLCIADGFELNREFQLNAIDNFGSNITVLDFSQPRKALVQINKWVAEQTKYKIENLLSPDAVNQYTQLVVVNAVYYKGLWETKFNPENTKPGEFYLRNGQTKTVPFMRKHHSFQYGEDNASNSIITILPFENQQYSLILILPGEDNNVDNVVSTLTNTKLVSYHKFEKYDIQLNIPKFTLKSDTDLIAVLKVMGISSVFDQYADLSRIGTYRTFSPRISNALHTGYMSIDEQGVSAAAASSFTAIALSYDDSSITFTANRPFVGVLWDTKFAIPLFISKIEDPSI